MQEPWDESLGSLEGSKQWMTNSWVLQLLEPLTSYWYAFLEEKSGIYLLNYYKKALISAHQALWHPEVPVRYSGFLCMARTMSVARHAGRHE